VTTRPGHRDRRAAAIVAKNPGITGRELGRKLGVSERTGRRVLARHVSSSHGDTESGIQRCDLLEPLRFEVQPERLHVKVGITYVDPEAHLHSTT
jgi:hypothetical protein